MYETIRALCVQKGMSVSALETEMGFSIGSIKKWESSSPSIDRVIKVANYFGVGLNYIIGEDKKITQPAEGLGRDEVVSGVVTLFNALKPEDQALALAVLEAIRKGSDNNT